MFDARAYRMSERCLFAGVMACAGLVLAIAPQTVNAQACTEAAATQSISDQGVTVAATPKSTGSAGNRWEFIVVLDTHSGDLSDDLTQSTTLTTGQGRTFSPVSWLGAPPGGHHREGVLSFDVPGPRPSVIELRIARHGESTPRIFRWKL